MGAAKVYSISHIGNSRENHEDNYLLGGQFMSPQQVKDLAITRSVFIQKETLSGDFCVAVSDGMGGYECGEVASYLTVKYLSENYERLTRCGYTDEKKEIISIVSDLNRTVCSEAKKQSETKNIGATLCGVVSSNSRLLCFNVGDSRMYRYSNGSLAQITIDNTEGQRLVGLGLLTEEEVKTFPKRKAIYKYIGKDCDLIPDIYSVDSIKDGDFILLCSDGLTDVVDPEEIQDMLSKKFIKTEDKGRFLVEMAVERKQGAGDNVTLIIIEGQGEEP